MLTHWCYNNLTFFGIIKQVEDNSSLNPVQMSVKQWYNYLLEEYVTMEVIDDEGRQQAKCAGLRFLIQIMNGQNPSTCPGCVNYLQKMVILLQVTIPASSFQLKTIINLPPQNVKLSEQETIYIL